MKPSPFKTVRERLREHLADPDSIFNDSTVDQLYREAHSVCEDEQTDLEAVEKWASEIAR